MVQNPQQTKDLWAEALRRAAAEDARFPHNQPDSLTLTYRQALWDAGQNETLAAAALDLATGQPALLAAWAAVAPVSRLDREMPGLLANPGNARQRAGLFQFWMARGSKAAAAGFAQQHPDLGLAPPPVKNN